MFHTDTRKNGAVRAAAPHSRAQGGVGVSSAEIQTHLHVAPPQGGCCSGDGQGQLQSSLPAPAVPWGSAGRPNAPHPSPEGSLPPLLLVHAGRQPHLPRPQDVVAGEVHGPVEVAEGDAEAQHHVGQVDGSLRRLQSVGRAAQAQHCGTEGQRSERGGLGGVTHTHTHTQSPPPPPCRAGAHSRFRPRLRCASSCFTLLSSAGFAPFLRSASPANVHAYCAALRETARPQGPGPGGGHRAEAGPGRGGRRAGPEPEGGAAGGLRAPRRGRRAAPHLKSRSLAWLCALKRTHVSMALPIAGSSARPLPAACRKSRWVKERRVPPGGWRLRGTAPPHRLLPLAGRAGARPQGSKQRLRLGHCNSPRLNLAEEPSDWPDSRSSSRPLVPTPASAALRFDSLFAVTVSAALQLAAAPEAPPPSRVPHSRLAPARRELPSAFTLLRRSPTPIGPPPSSSPPTPRISALGLVSPSPPRPSSPSAHPIGHRRPLSPPPRRGDLHAHWPRAP